MTSPMAGLPTDDLPLVEELLPAPDPVLCCERLAGLPWRLFLDSASRDARLGRYSFRAADPSAVVWSKGTRVERIALPGGDRRPLAGDALDAARALLGPRRLPVAGLPPFQGGMAGYIG